MQQKARFDIEGMTCQACANRIEKVLNKKDFISEAGVNFASEDAQITFDSSKTSPEAIAQIIEKTGYKATLHTDGAQPDITSSTQLGWRLWLLILINIPFLIGMAGMMSGHHEWMMPAMVQFALASVVQLWLAWPFYKGAWASIKGGLANMDVLVTLGTVSIYAYSAFIMFYHQSLGHDGMAHVYFEAGVMIIGFVSFGKYLEQRAKKQSLNSLGLLLKLTPAQVSVQRDGHWQSLALDQVQIGDILRANHGERIAADGIVTAGSGWADESHLTGESQPQSKREGSQVLAGAMITDGSVQYRAEQLGNRTLLGDMMAALSEAQGSKAPIARIADKVAGLFVPVVVAIALATFAITWLVTGSWSSGLMHAVAVLVIACPCALVISTPVSIVSGLAAAARKGILVKGGVYLEQGRKLKWLALDKTGTLTHGKPVQTDFAVLGNRLPENGQVLASSLAARSDHPVSQAIARAAAEQGITAQTVNEFSALAGRGVQGEIDGVHYVLGNHRLIHERGLCSAELENRLAALEREGKTVVLLADEVQVLALFAVADTVKESSREAIAQLHQLGINTVMLSGDNPHTAAAIAAQVGIDRAYGDQLPQDKLAAVEKLAAEGAVGMVGDGINDAPALARADIGFAMGAMGTDTAIETADVALMDDDLRKIPAFVRLSQATHAVLVQNIVLALAIKAVFLALTIAGLGTMWMAVFADVGASLLVVGNGLRLLRK